jgi:hypothetical protein
LSACLPGAGGIDDFWSFLRRGGDVIGPIPRDRWDVDDDYRPDPAHPGRSSVREGGFLSAIDRLGANFFGISSREACRIDPRQRILLELTWEALEHADIVPAGGLGYRRLHRRLVDRLRHLAAWPPVRALSTTVQRRRRAVMRNQTIAAPTLASVGVPERGAAMPSSARATRRPPRQRSSEAARRFRG